MTAPDAPELRPARPLRRGAGTPDAAEQGADRAEFDELRAVLGVALQHLVELRAEVQTLSGMIERLTVARAARPLRASTKPEKPADEAV